MDWKKTIGVLAPGLAGMLGGPLMGNAVKAITSALGLSENASDQAMEQALNNLTGEQALALKQNENKLKMTMRQADVDIYNIDAEDRQSARKREQIVGSLMTNLLGVIIVGAFLTVVGYIIIEGMPTNPEGVLIGATTIGMLIGYLSNKAEQVVAFYFGSSAGSKQKTEKLAEKFGKMNG